MTDKRIMANPTEPRKAPANINQLKLFGKVNLGEPSRLRENGTLADGVGFEPTVGFHPRRFSRPLP